MRGGRDAPAAGASAALAGAHMAGARRAHIALAGAPLQL
jgi:hypothetical protein